MVAAALLCVFVVETFAVGFLLSQSRELKAQNELLRDFNAHFAQVSTQDWPSVVEESAEDA